jgi:hypothetical protein
MGLWVRDRIKNPGFRSRKAKIAWEKRGKKKRKEKKKKREKTSCFEVLDVVFGLKAASIAWKSFVEA